MRKFFTLLLLSSVFYGYGQDFKSELIDQETGSIAVADFDGDTYPDIFGVQFKSSKADVYLLTNKKIATKPTFERKNIILDFDFRGRPYAFDADNDGDMDVLYAKNATWDMEVYLNDGKGNFTSKALGVAGSTRFEVMDMDKDGDLDIVGINYVDKIIYLYTNAGNMTYTRLVLFKDNSELEEFNIGDLNNDGLPEIAIAIEAFTGDQVVVLENKGNNFYQKRTIIKDTFFGVVNVTINDINKDGKNDLVINNYRSIELAINTGNFQFTDKSLIFIDEGYIVGFTIQDITGESERDVIICTSRKTIWLKDVNKTDFSHEVRAFSGVNSIFTFHAADFNKDGALDFSSANFGLRVFTNNIPQLPSDVNDIQTHLKVYPNPAKDVVYVDGTDGTDMTAHFYNQVGMLVQEVAVKGGQVDVSSLSSGSYIFTIIDASGKVVGRSKMVKE